jgi:hypothetical protein
VRIKSVRRRGRLMVLRFSTDRDARVR